MQTSEDHKNVLKNALPEFPEEHITCQRNTELLPAEEHLKCLPLVKLCVSWRSFKSCSARGMDNLVVKENRIACLEVLTTLSVAGCVMFCT